MTNQDIVSGRTWQASGLAIIRIVTGLFMVYHGWEVFDVETMKGYTTWDQFKNHSNPSLMVYTGKIAELIAGLLLAFGFLTRIAAIVIAGTMLYVSLFVGHGKIWYEDQHPFLFVLLGLVFFFTGSIKWGLDNVLFKK